MRTFAVGAAAVLFAAVAVFVAGAVALDVDFAFVCAPSGRARERREMRISERMRLACIGPPEIDRRENLQATQTGL
jgi:hypothetical protein